MTHLAQRLTPNLVAISLLATLGCSASSGEADGGPETTDFETTDNPTDTGTISEDGGVDSETGTDSVPPDWLNPGCDKAPAVFSDRLRLEVEVDLSDHENGRYLIRETVTVRASSRGSSLTLFGERLEVSRASAGFAYDNHTATFCTEPFEPGDDVSITIEFTSDEKRQATLPMVNWGLRRWEGSGGLVIGPFNEPYYAVDWLFVPQSLQRVDGTHDDSPALESVSLTVLAPSAEWIVIGPSGPAQPEADAPRFTFETQTPMPLYALSFAASPDYELFEIGESASGVQIFAAVFPASAAAAREALGSAVTTVDWMETNIGPLDFGDAFAFAEIPGFGGGMEHVGGIWIGSDIIAAGKLGQFVAVHETVHYWWGDSVRFADWPHFWLAEGFDEWSTNYNILPLLLEDTEAAANILDYRINGAALTYPMFPGMPQPGPLRFADDDDMTMHFLTDLQMFYVYGAAFLEMINQRLLRDHDSDLNELLAAWYDYKHLSSATTEEFLSFLQESTQEEVSWRELFDDWVYKGPAPTIRLSGYDFDPSTGRIRLSVERTGGANQALEDLEFVFCDGELPRRVSVDLPAGTDAAEVSAVLDAAPTAIAVDPLQLYVFRLVTGDDWTGPETGFGCN